MRNIYLIIIYIFTGLLISVLDLMVFNMLRDLFSLIILFASLGLLMIVIYEMKSEEGGR